MELQLVNKEIAIQLKELGFIYMKANCYGDNMCYQLPEGELINALKGNTVAGYILAPTQALVCKWLRDIHNLNIKIDTTDLFTSQITKIKHKLNYNDSILYFEEGFESYEKAEEAGILQAIKLLKEKKI